MNELAVATDIIRNSWCKGAYRSQFDGKETFCSVGALVQANGIITGLGYENGNPSDESLAILAEVIKENYLTELNSYRADQHGDALAPVEEWSDESLVITFNDEIVNAHHEVVAMFEKATARYEEGVQ